MNKQMLMGVVAGVGIATAGGVLGFQYLGKPGTDGAAPAEEQAVAVAPAAARPTPRCREALGFRTSRRTFLVQKNGSSPNSGEGGADLQEKVRVVAEAIRHPFDHLDLVVHAFD